MIKSQYTPKSLTFCHDDSYNEVALTGHREKRKYDVFHQALMLSDEDTIALKKFLRGVKQIDVRIGMSKEGEGPYFVQFMGFTERSDGDSYEDDIKYPPIPDL